MRTVRGLSLLILLLLLAATVHAEEETRPLPVVCPVLDDFWGPKPGGLIRLGNQPLSLVILGTGRQVTDRRVEIEVEDTFFGVPPQGPITLRSHRPDGDMGRRIFYLQEDVWEDGLHALHGGSDPDMLPPTSANLIGAKALVEARWMHLVLTAEAVFVGREMAFAPRDGPDNKWNDEFSRDIVVHRVLSGPMAFEGRTVRVDVPETKFVGQEVRLEDGPRIYVVGRRNPDGFARGSREPKPLLERSSLEVKQTFPVAGAAMLEATLGRRESLPIVRKQREDGAVDVREIVFPGTVVEALLALDSDCEKAAAYTARSLVLRAQEARTPVRREIGERLLDPEVEGWDHHRVLRRLIRILARMEEAEPRGHVDDLIERWLAHLASGARGPGYLRDEHYGVMHRSDVNHSLAWLLLSLDAETARARYGSRLLELARTADVGWHTEIRLLLDALQFRDTREMPAALNRGHALTRTRSLPGPIDRLGQICSQVAFSHDGRHLAFDSGFHVYLLEARDWTVVAKLPFDASASRLLFSPDDRLLYVAGGGGGRGALSRHAVPSLSLDHTYDVHARGIDAAALSLDGLVLATLSFCENRLLFTDTRSGAVLREVETHTLVTPDAPHGLGVLRSDGDDGWVLEPFHGGSSRPFSLLGLDADRGCVSLAVSADGRMLVWAQLQGFARSGGDEGGLVAWRYDGDVAHQVGARALMPAGSTQVPTVSPDGSRCAVAGPGNVVRVFSLPTLEPLGQVTLARPRGSDLSVRRMAFSPNGRVLAASQGRALPALIDLETFERLRAFPGDAERIVHVAFEAGGETVVTRGRNDIACRWDAMSLRRLDVSRTPSEEVENHQDTCLSEDGRTRFEAARFGRGDRPAVVKRIDVITGKSVDMKIADCRTLRARRFGLVPGGRALYLADPGMLVLAREDLTPVSDRAFEGIRLHGVAFSGDGSRYALTTEADDYPAEIRRRLPAGTKGLLRVHDTCTGETLLAIPLTRRPVVIALDETGHRAILAHTDGSIELIR